MAHNEVGNAPVLVRRDVLFTREKKTAFLEQKFAQGFLSRLSRLFPEALAIWVPDDKYHLFTLSSVTCPYLAGFVALVQPVIEFLQGLARTELCTLLLLVLCPSAL